MTIPSETIERIKTAADIVEVIGREIPLKKNGKDYEGLCPFHSEKTPSFSVSREKNFFYCFGCGAHGDVIEYLVKKDGIPFLDAAHRLAREYGVELDQAEGCRLKAEVKTRNYKPETRNHGYAPEKSLPPAEIWQKKAEKLVTWAHESLLGNETRLAWLAERGIDLELVKEFRLGWNPGEAGKDLYRPRESWGLAPEYKKDGKTKKIIWMPIGFVISLVMDNRVLRIRFRPDSGKPKYILLPGSDTRCMVLGAHASRAYVIIETELDAIMVWSKVRENKIGVIGLGTAQKHPEIETYELLKTSPVILNAMDYDPPGIGAVYRWWKKRFLDNHKYWPVRVGKDPGDAYKAGEDIAEWIRLGLPEAWNWVKKGSRIQGFKRKPETTNHKPETGLSPETFGRSNLLNVNERGVPESAAPEDGGPLSEFVSLIKNSPAVTVRVSADRLFIDEPDMWARKNWERSRRLSHLVFMDKEVRSFLMGLGAAEVNSRNIESRLKAID